MACALLERRITLAELVDAVVRRADIQEPMARGHISRPPATDELFAKFASCLDFASTDLDRHGLFDALHDLDRQPAGWLPRIIANRARAVTAAAPASP